MQTPRGTWPAVFILLFIVAVSATGMWPDLAASRIDLNDNISHFALIERIVGTVEHGGNPLDAWSPEWTFGFPMLRLYQTLAHLLVAGVYFALGKSVSLMTVFVWVRFLAVVLLPVSFYFAARMLDLGRPAALAAAAMAPLISSNGLFGLEYGSYVWAGNGLFPQSVAAHLFLLSLGFGWRALRRGKGLTVAGVLLGLIALAHLIFGYMGALSLLLAALLPDREVPRAVRLGRTLRIGAAALAIAAFQLLPLALDSAIINHSRWEPSWKWDGFGAVATLRYLVTGQMLDANRLPVLSLAALAGIGVVLWRRRRDGQAVWLLAAAGLWLAMLFGRPFWGRFSPSPESPPICNCIAWPPVRRSSWCCWLQWPSVRLGVRPAGPGRKAAVLAAALLIAVPHCRNCRAISAETRPGPRQPDRLHRRGACAGCRHRPH